MSNLHDRRNSPRRRERTMIFGPLHMVVLVYSILPMIVFIGTGEWADLCLTLGMLKWSLR